MKATHYYAPDDSTVTYPQARAVFDAVLRHLDIDSPEIAVIAATRKKRRYTILYALSESFCSQFSLPLGTICQIDGVHGKRMGFSLIECRASKH